MNRPDKNDYYLQLALDIARRSTCLRRCYGAVIVNNDEIISTGYNGAPRERVNCMDCGHCLREELNIAHGEKYEACRSIHAEMNAIISASRKDMIGATLYLAGYDAVTGEELDRALPCKMCERAIINSNIRYIVNKVTNIPNLINVKDFEDDFILSKNQIKLCIKESILKYFSYNPFGSVIDENDITNFLHKNYNTNIVSYIYSETDLKISNISFDNSTNFEKNVSTNIDQIIDNIFSNVDDIIKLSKFITNNGYDNCLMRGLYISETNYKLLFNDIGKIETIMIYIYNTLNIHEYIKINEDGTKSFSDNVTDDEKRVIYYMYNKK